MPAEARNLKLLAHDPLGGFGNGGEGMAVQITPDGRRVLWVAHESAPTNFTAVDVSDPRRPHVIAQTALPHARVRSIPSTSPVTCSSSPTRRASSG